MYTTEQISYLIETLRKEIHIRKTMIDSRADFEQSNPDATLEQIKRNQLFVNKQTQIMKAHIEMIEIAQDRLWNQ